jgi:hypothetical protein
MNWNNINFTNSLITLYTKELEVKSTKDQNATTRNLTVTTVVTVVVI